MEYMIKQMKLLTWINLRLGIKPIRYRIIEERYYDSRRIETSRARFSIQMNQWPNGWKELEDSCFFQDMFEAKECLVRMQLGNPQERFKQYQIYEQ